MAEEKTSLLNLIDNYLDRFRIKGYRLRNKDNYFQMFYFKCRGFEVIGKRGEDFGILEEVSKKELDKIEGFLKDGKNFEDAVIRAERKNNTII